MFLFAAITSFADIIKRGRNHEALTGGEAALLRLFDGVTVALLLAGWAAFQRYGPTLPAVHDIAGATMAAVLLAWQKWAAGSGLAQLEAGMDPASGNLATGPSIPASTVGVAPGGSVAPEPPSGATAFARSAPPALGALHANDAYLGWTRETTPGTAPAAPYVPRAGALLGVNGATDGETEGDWEGEAEPVSPTASGRYRTLADMPQPSATTQPVNPPAPSAPAAPSPVQTPGWLLGQPVNGPIAPPSEPAMPDPAATVAASQPPAATAAAADPGEPQEEGMHP